MPQTVFLDTGVLLDYIENRHQEIRDIIAQLILLHKKGRIVLATSIFNVAELLDKEFEIRFSGWGLNERMAFDEIRKLRGNEKLFKDVCEKNKTSIEKGVNSLVFENELPILYFPEGSQYEELYDLIYRYQLESQDALIVTAALANKVTYFLSNDAYLVKKIKDMLDTYNLRKEPSRTAFRRNVIEAIA